MFDSHGYIAFISQAKQIARCNESWGKGFHWVFEQKVKKEKKQQDKPKPKFGSAKGMFVMHDDFDEPLEDFKDYM